MGNSRKFIGNPVMFLVMSVVLILVITMVYITTPEYVSHEASGLVITENSGKIEVELDSPSMKCEIWEDSDNTYHISVWESKWSKLTAKHKKEKAAINPEGTPVNSVYYDSNNGKDSKCIYGFDRYASGNGGMIVLPRLFLAKYAILAVQIMVGSGFLLFVLRRHKNVVSVFHKIIIIPITFLLSLIAVKGWNTATYAGTRDLMGILLVTIPMFFVLVMAQELWENRKSAEKKEKY